ncbi:MAG: binding-protein-dependent transport system inner rane component [Clostridia bacterium]|jgi:raffinose/stachyose/melibiose transport system permease protein|nr:binding-protein-dependent transport system inner rane component [Clostridia bacterium]
MKAQKVNVKKGILTSILSLIALTQLFPLYWLLMFSLKDNVEISGANILGFPRVWRWEHYVRALTDSDIPRYFINSVIYSSVTVILSGLLAAMAGYGITRMKWKLKGAVFGIFVLGIMVPTHAALLPLFQVLDFLGLKGGYLGLVLPYIAFAIPMSVMILSSFYTAIPREIEEAAYIDGCGIMKTFVAIILPIVKPAIATSSIFAFLGTWNELLFANTLIDNGLYKTLTVGIMSFAGQYSTEWGLIGAGMVIATVPTIIIYFMLSNQVQQSIIAGAIKG